MYKTLKTTISKLLPRSFIIKNELAFRYVFGLFYRGNSHQCNVCSNTLKSFISIQSGDLLCPFCGSLSRTRRLWQELNNDNAISGKVLHFSPSRSLYRQMKSSNEIAYFSSDYENEFLAEYRYDITAIDHSDATFNLIICYHILEHIEQDIKAMEELFRVLKLHGRIYIQTPFKEGDIYEDSQIKTPEERLKHFGQEDHVRVYSIAGLESRLQNVGFKTEVVRFSKSEEDNYHGLISPETIIKLLI